ncbi:MAG: hypothetical protein K0U40_04990 [Betaproteobacteria bacterium]|nr:hypothetical protein [Betaproteobacteria bacterium]
MFITSGCSSLTPVEDSITAQPELAESITSFPANIGLLEDDDHDSKLLFTSFLPSEIFGKNDEKIIFLKNLHLKSQEFFVGSWRNMKQGAVDGAKFGFKVGPDICATSAHVALISLGGLVMTRPPREPFLLCGVAAASAGFIPGSVLGPILYPIEKQKTHDDTSFVKQILVQDPLYIKQTIVQETWRNLIKLGQIQRDNALQSKGDQTKINNPYEKFEFGQNTRPFDGFVQIQPMQPELIHIPCWTAGQMTLRNIVQLTLLDKNKETLIEKRIQVDEGLYTLAEWSDNEGFLLRTQMGKAHQRIAKKIVSSLQADPDSLPGEHHVSNLCAKESQNF